MIKIPTVFILGAGASKPYGYPSGNELIQLICDNLMTDHKPQFKQLRGLGCKDEDIITFKEALYYSGQPSVDAFLEHRQDLVEIGKSAIAQALMGYESTDTLFETGDWYQYLYEKMSTSFDRFDQNNIAIITFNYDRSLEHYLFTALKHSYNKTEEQCAEKLRDIPIIHVHGQLSYLPWQDAAARKYGLSGPEHIRAAAAQIRIISESIDIPKDETFNQARYYLQEADRVFFLGFAYHRPNVERLYIRSSKQKSFHGTGYHIEQGERDTIHAMFTKYSCNITLRPISDTVLDFLRRQQNVF